MTSRKRIESGCSGKALTSTCQPTSPCPHKIPALRLFFGRSGKRETSALLSRSKWKMKTKPENGNNTADLFGGKGKDGKKHEMDPGDEETCLQENAGKNRRKHRPGIHSKESHRNMTSTKREFDDKMRFHKVIGDEGHNAEKTN